MPIITTDEFMNRIRALVGDDTSDETEDDCDEENGVPAESVSEITEADAGDCCGGISEYAEQTVCCSACLLCGLL